MTASPMARLFLIGIWTQAWDDGVFEWKPVTLKARIMPADSVDVAPLLAELERLDVVKRFAVNDKNYGVIRNFRKFQSPRFPNSSGFLTEDLRDYVGLAPETSEESNDETPPKPKGSAKRGNRGVSEPASTTNYGNGTASTQRITAKHGNRTSDGVGEEKEEGIGDSFYENGSGTRASPPSFPVSGSIAWRPPWNEIARSAGRNIDVDIFATAFRDFLRKKSAPFDAPGIEKSFRSFCREHKVAGLHA